MSIEKALSRLYEVFRPYTLDGIDIVNIEGCYCTTKADLPVILSCPLKELPDEVMARIMFSDPSWLGRDQYNQAIQAIKYFLPRLVEYVAKTIAMLDEDFDTKSCLSHMIFCAVRDDSDWTASEKDAFLSAIELIVKKHLSAPPHIQAHIIDYGLYIDLSVDTLLQYWEEANARERSDISTVYKIFGYNIWDATSMSDDSDTLTVFLDRLIDKLTPEEIADIESRDNYQL